MSSKPKEKKKMCNQVLDIQAMSVIQRNIEGRAFDIAIQRWVEEIEISKLII